MISVLTSNFLSSYVTGDNAQDVARWWADPRVTEIVNAKFESVPPKEKKGKKGKKGGRGKSGSKKKGGSSRAQSVPPLPQGGLTQQTSGMSGVSIFG